MKTSRINILTAVSASCVLLVALLMPATSLMAGEIATGKGNAKLLMKQQAPPAYSGQHSMACPRCQDEFMKRVDTSARGAIKPTITVAHHLCGACETKLSTVGAGKAKKDIVSHVCNVGGVPNLTCCAL